MCVCVCVCRFYETLWPVVEAVVVIRTFMALSVITHVSGPVIVCHVSGTVMACRFTSYNRR